MLAEFSRWAVVCVSREQTHQRRPLDDVIVSRLDNHWFRKGSPRYINPASASKSHTAQHPRWSLVPHGLQRCHGLWGITAALTTSADRLLLRLRQRGLGTKNEMLSAWCGWNHHFAESHRRVGRRKGLARPTVSCRNRLLPSSQC